ncbi:MAG: carbamoyltransferase HypF [Deltaproteobacteria bacterium]|nr:carbamoyltransferase HypF [Deltaproteobacteria bacterium]
MGLMLPSTPMQVLLLAESRIPALVSTTADLAGWPVVTDDREAVERLGAVADAFLVHDRPIARRNHDPVLRPIAGRLRPLRLSRGSAPLSLPLANGPTVLAIGGDRKNAPAIAGHGRVHLLPHVGDLDHPAAVDELVATVTHHARLLDLWPDVVAHDLDDGCASSRAARSLGLPMIAVQHHHAHFASCLVDRATRGPALGVVLDGPGLGLDGTAWGGEILVGGVNEVRRLARLSLVAMPGGAVAATREPWRMAVAALEAAFPGADLADELGLVNLVGRERLDRARGLARAGGPAAPRTSSCARLFDAVAALLGLVTERAEEGRGGVLVEALARRALAAPAGNDAALGGGEPSPDRDADGDPMIPSAIVDTLSLVREVVASIRAGRDPGHTALAFHLGLAGHLARATVRLARWTGVHNVALSGGCASNAILVESLRNRLESRGLVVHLAEHVPATDAGLAVGQAAVASARLATWNGEDLRGSGVR